MNYVQDVNVTQRELKEIHKEDTWQFYKLINDWGSIGKIGYLSMASRERISLIWASFENVRLTSMNLIWLTVGDFCCSGKILKN